MFEPIFRRLWVIPFLVTLASIPLLATAAPQNQSAFGKPVSRAALASHSGGYELTLSQENLNAVLTHNKAFDNTTGNNLISGHAFAGASGIPTVIQNSGNNVIIQNATILNVQVR